MNDEILAYYRLLALTYRRFLQADAALQSARENMRTIFPANRMPYGGAIGSERSRIRRLIDERTDALIRLETSYAKFNAAKQRASRRRVGSVEVFQLTLMSE